jgi:hypothetical protein
VIHFVIFKQEIFLPKEDDKHKDDLLCTRRKTIKELTFDMHGEFISFKYQSWQQVVKKLK